MENEIITNIDLKDVGIFITGVAIPSIVYLIKTISAEWRKNAPLRKARRRERREILAKQKELRKLEKKKKKELKKMNL